MKTVAVIGAGISGMAVAYYLSRKYDVSLYEQDGRLGGHTHTVDVQSSRGPLPVDTGFIVHNDRTYPNLIKLLAELGVARQDSDMSFAVTCRDTGFEYSSRGLRGLFAQPSNLVRPAHYRFLAEILRFNRRAARLLAQPDAGDITLGDYLERERFSRPFRHYYLYPMASAVWSTSIERIRSFPALTLIRFFHNHGMLGIFTHPQWKVIRGGSRTYIPPLTAPYRHRIHLGSKVEGIRREPAEVTLRIAGRDSVEIDHVVLACHGDQVLPLLENPTETENDLFRHFRPNRNEVCLHRDASLLPSRRAARASWNYNLGLAGKDTVSLTYHMNRLQSLPVPEDYCVTLNATQAIDPCRVLRTMQYNHPLFTADAVRAQQRWEEVSGRNRTHYCGAYWFNGFHEDGVKSALRAARAMGVEC